MVQLLLVLQVLLDQVLMDGDVVNVKQVIILIEMKARVKIAVLK